MQGPRACPGPPLSRNQEVADYQVLPPQHAPPLLKAMRLCVHLLNLSLLNARARGLAALRGGAGEDRECLVGQGAPHFVSSKARGAVELLLLPL